MIIWAFCPEEYIILCSFLFVTPCARTLVAISSSIFMLNWNWSVALSSFLWCSACWVSKLQLLQYRNIHFLGSAMFYWSVNTVIFLWSLLDRFICLSPLDPSYVQTGWGDFVRIRRLKWKSYSPLQARFIIWNQKMLSRIHTSLFVWEPFYAFRI